MINQKDTPMDYKQFEGATPGPWKVRTKEEFELTNDLYHSIRAINGPSFDEPGFDITGCISWVDASLIAAAPDLLKENQELKAALEHCKDLGKIRDEIKEELKLELQKQKELNAELVKEVEQLILHAEEDSLNYSVLEHARKLVFKITHPDEYDRYQKAE